MYNKGGCMAKAGSCKIGLKPKPFSCTGKTLSKGFEVKIVKTIKPNDIKDWISKDFEIKTKFFLLYNLNIK